MTYSIDAEISRVLLDMGYEERSIGMFFKGSKEIDINAETATFSMRARKTGIVEDMYMSKSGLLRMLNGAWA